MRFRLLNMLLVALSLAAVNATAATQAPRDPSKYFFNDSFYDLPSELANARAHGKQGILVMFEMADCPFCHRMKTTILNQPDVQDYFRKHFVILSIDIKGDLEMVDFHGKSTTMKDFAFKEYRVRATPVFAFFNLKGKLVTRYTGATSDKEEFMLLGKYVVGKVYEKMPFIRYKRKQMAGQDIL